MEIEIAIAMAETMAIVIYLFLAAKKIVPKIPTTMPGIQIRKKRIMTTPSLIYSVLFSESSKWIMANMMTIIPRNIPAKIA